MKKSNLFPKLSYRHLSHCLLSVLLSGLAAPAVAQTSTEPVITIAGGATVAEGTAAVFTVTATPSPTMDLTVNLTVTDVENSNFVAAENEGSKEVSITSGSSSATYTVTTDDDSKAEENGNITVSLQDGTGYTVGSTSSASVAVTNDDTAQLTLSSADSPNWEEGTSITVTITLDHTPETATFFGDPIKILPGGNVYSSGTSFTYSFTSDFLNPGRRISFLYDCDRGPRKSCSNVAGTVADDVPNREITLDLAGSRVLSNSYVTLGSSSSLTFTRIDKDPTIVTLAGVDTVKEDGTDNAEVTVSLSRNLVAGETVTVPLTVSGTGIAGSDYTIALKAGSNLNNGVMLSTGNPYSAAGGGVHWPRFQHGADRHPDGGGSAGHGG